MPDNTTNRGQQDTARINVNQDHELRYWCERFNIQPDQLREAVNKVGVSVDNVERYLKGNSL